MAQTLVRLLVHLVFSTKNRRNLITPDVEPELFGYMAGVLKNLNSVCLEVNGTANHVHTLLSQSKNIALADLVEEVKKSSSKWIKTKDRQFRQFQWQKGYGGFSIGESAVPALRRYIRSQKSTEKGVSKRSFSSY